MIFSMNFDDARNDAFEFRNPKPSAYLNRDALSELGLSALPGGAGGAGAMGEHTFLQSLGLEESSTNVILLYMYLYGTLCFGDITYYLGFSNSSLTPCIQRLTKRSLCSTVQTSHVSYKSGKFYVADYNSEMCRLFEQGGLNPAYSRESGGTIAKPLLPHTYGASLSIMMINLFCHLRDGYSVERVLYEKSISINNKEKYVKRASADATVDVIADVLTPSGRIRTVNVEFDTGTERLETVTEKFLNYYGTPAYSANADSSAFFNQLMLFSCNKIDMPVNKFKSISSFEELFRFFVRAVILSAYRLDASMGSDISSVLQLNAASYMDSDCFMEFNAEYRDVASLLPSGVTFGWAARLFSLVFPAFGPFIASSEDGGNRLRELLTSFVDPGILVKERNISDLYELSDYCDAFGKSASDTFTFNNMKESLFYYLSREEYVNHPSESTFFKCPEPGTLERKEYNRKQYMSAFNRHVGIAAMALSFAEGKVTVDNGSISVLEVPDRGDMVKISALYSGYQVYTAAAHLLSNSLPSILGKDDDWFTTDGAIKYVSSYIISRYSTKKCAISEDLNLDCVLGKARMRDCLVDNAKKMIYSVSDASIETTALVRTAILQRHYSPISNGNSGYHIVSILIVKSFNEMRKISKNILFSQTLFLNDDKSTVVFVLHPELDFGFRSDSPVFYTVTARGKIIETVI